MPANPAQLDKAERLEWPGRVYSLCYDEKLNTHWDKGKGEDTGHAELDLNGSTTFSGVCQCLTGHVHTVDSMKEQMEREKRKKKCNGRRTNTMSEIETSAFRFCPFSFSRALFSGAHIQINRCWRMRLSI